MRPVVAAIVLLSTAGPALSQSDLSDAGVRSLALEVLANLHDGQAGKVHARLSAEVRTQVPVAEFSASWDALATDFRMPIRSEVVAVTWYDDPDSDGRVAAVDYALRYANHSIACEYQVWTPRNDASEATLIRCETQFIPADLVTEPIEEFARQFQKTLCKTIPNDMLDPRT